jgi:hypothetical protein
MKHADKKMDKAVVKKMLKEHASKPASKAHKGLAKGGGVKIRGTGAATKGLYARGPMA